jgi:oxygen-independent coproporphyrinogen-3 oxidase
MAWAPCQHLSLYLHIPFCQARCAYCDFNTYADLGDWMTPYAAALAQEIRLVGEAYRAAHGERATAHTVFFGGGTPSLLPLAQYALLLAALHEAFTLLPDCEITLEANPGTVDRAYLMGLRQIGVNRLSFGVQSSHPHELQMLDRRHLFGDAAQAVTWARAAGFDNLNLDLMFALPHQTLRDWQATLHRALALGPEHLSAYALALEHGTPMRAWVYRGLLPMPDPDLAAAMYEWASETLEKNGFAQYEISNWGYQAGQPGPDATDRRADTSALALGSLPLTTACRHNLQYWRNGPYLGLGAGAHGCAAGWRYANVLAPQAYVARLSRRPAEVTFPFSPAVSDTTALSPETEMDETLLLGLRLIGEGVRAEAFYARFGMTLAARYRKPLTHLRALGLLEWDTAGARLTPAGRLLGNRVFREFV